MALQESVGVEVVPQGARLVPRADELIARMERLPWTRKHWNVAGVLCTATFFDGYDNLMVTSVLPLLVVSLGLAPASLGLFISAGFWGQTIGSPVAGAIAERWGRRTVMLVSCVLMGITAVGAALAQDQNQLIIARGIQGFGLGAELPVAGAMFNEFVKGKQRGLAGLAYEAMFGWGGVVAPWLGLGLIALGGQDIAWRGMFLFGAVPLAMVFVRQRLLPESPRWLINQERFDEAEATIVQFEDSARRYGQPLSEPVIVAQPAIKKTDFLELFSRQYRAKSLMVIVWIAGAFTYLYGYMPFVAALYTTVGGLAVTSSLWLTLAGQAVSIPYNYLVAFTLDRMGRKFYFGWGLLFTAVVLLIGAVVVGLLGFHSWLVLFVITTVANLGTTTASGVYVYVPELYPTRMRAWATAMGSTVVRGVASFMPIVVGLVTASALGLGGVYILLALTVSVGGLSILLFGPETRGRVLEEIAM